MARPLLAPTLLKFLHPHSCTALILTLFTPRDIAMQLFNLCTKQIFIFRISAPSVGVACFEFLSNDRRKGRGSGVCHMCECWSRQGERGGNTGEEINTQVDQGSLLTFPEVISWSIPSRRPHVFLQREVCLLNRGFTTLYPLLRLFKVKLYTGGRLKAGSEGIL